jgi:hypothetical protein
MQPGEETLTLEQNIPYQASASDVEKEISMISKLNQVQMLVPN